MVEWVLVAAAIGTAAYSAEQQKKEAKRQIKAAEKAQAKQFQFETEAGEHWEELNLQQMELQSQSHQIQLLANLIEKQSQPEPAVFTLPAAKTYSPVDRINQAIDELFKG